MKYVILGLLPLLASCGSKHEHKASGVVEVQTQVWIAYKKMYEELLYVCQDAFGVEGEDFVKCKKKAVDKLAEMLMNEKVKKEQSYE